MSKLKIEKDNVVLSIDAEDLNQYEARGYTKVGAAKKVAPEKLEKEVTKLTKEVEKLTTEKEALEERISKLEEPKTEKTGDPKESNNKR